ncbi:MAG TPA: hypothetical protein VMV22_02410 [Acidimicrobiales bacterium]|nr:hypothetical protein [Acidimicrobiales bacterium]
MVNEYRSVPESGLAAEAAVSTVAGVLLAGWIVVEVAVIGEFSVLPAVFLAAAVAFVVLGRVSGRSPGRRPLRPPG